jgi:hypothetical protein
MFLGFSLGSMVIYLWMSHRTSVVKSSLGGCRKSIRWVEWVCEYWSHSHCNHSVVIFVTIISLMVVDVGLRALDLDVGIIHNGVSVWVVLLFG